jgi:hypothetical protein
MTLRLAAALAFVLQAFPAAAGDFEGVADLKMMAGDQRQMEGTGRLYLTSKAWRMETDMRPTATAKPEAKAALGGAESFRMVVFGKLAEPRKTWTLNERTKTYSVMKADPESRHERDAEKDEWTVTRIGKDHVAGMACENVKAQRKGSNDWSEACLAREFLSGAWTRALKETSTEGWMIAAQRAGVEGYPIRMITHGKDGKETYRIEVVKTERKSLPASLFEVPAGYRETSMMGTMAQTPEQQKQMEDAQKKMDEALKNMSPEQRKQMEEMMQKMGGKKP